MSGNHHFFCARNIWVWFKIDKSSVRVPTTCVGSYWHASVEFKHSQWSKSWYPGTLVPFSIQCLINKLITHCGSSSTPFRTCGPWPGHHLSVDNGQHLLIWPRWPRRCQGLRRSGVQVWGLRIKRSHMLHGAGILINIYHQNCPNIAIHSIHGACGIEGTNSMLGRMVESVLWYGCI